MSSPANTEPLTGRKAEVRAKLKELYDKDLDSFFLLVRAARVRTFIIKRCNFPVWDCGQEHPKCSDVTPYLGLVKSINATRHAEIDPEIRAIILESTTKELIMPRLAFRD